MNEIETTDLIFKEITNIFQRITEEDKEKILAVARDVSINAVEHQTFYDKDREIRNKSAEAFANMNRSRYMSVRASDFEKTVTLLRIISEKMNFKEKFRIIIEYDPELLNTSIEFYT